MEQQKPNEPKKGKMKDLWPLALVVLILIIGALIPPLTPPAMSQQKGDVNQFIFFMVVCPFMVAIILFYYMRIREMKQDLKDRQRMS
jgi:protein-S-isoprenylcysteine O-methyltransferase Ste14